MKQKDLLYLDFETEAIGPRPHAYPPKPVSYAYKLGKDKGFVHWGHHDSGMDNFDSARTKLADLFKRCGGVVCHNAPFDHEVCQEHMGLDNVGVMWHDTMILAFLHDPYGPLGLKPLGVKHLGLPPDEQDAVREWLVANGTVKPKQKDWGAYIARAPAAVVGPYAIGDIVRTEKLFKLYQQAKVTENPAYMRELRLSPVLMNMEQRGVRIDLKRLEQDTNRYFAILDDLDARLKKHLGDVDLDSDATIVEALERKGKLSKPLPLTESGAFSVSKNALIDCVKDKQLLGTMLMRGALATSIRTFMYPWLNKAREGDGRLYFKFNQVRNEGGLGAKTGRMSSSPSMMNIPSKWEQLYSILARIKYIRTFDLPDLREYILPDEGCVIAALDYSQQEMRLFAHFEDGALMRAYQEDPKIDAHEMVAKIAGIPRKAAKTLNFAALYGAGLGVVMQWLDCSESEASEFKGKYTRALPGVKDLSNSIKAEIAAGRPITTIGGREYFEEPPKYVEGRYRSFGYKLLNYLMQGSAADQTKQAMIDYQDSPKRRGRLMFSVHDELVISVPKACAVSDTKLLEQCMTNSFAADLDVKFLVDVSIGENYGKT